MQRNLSVWPDWPCRQRAKGSTLPKEILEAKPIGSYPLHKPEQLHFGYDPELNQSCSALIQQISPVAQSTRPLFTMAAQHTLQVSSSQGQHQNQSMPNKDFFFFFTTTCRSTLQARRKASSFPPETIWLVLAPCQTHRAFQYDYTFADGGFWALKAAESLWPTGPTSSTTCPASESRDATNTSMEGKRGVVATQDPALPAKRWGAEQRSGSHWERTHS